VPRLPAQPRRTGRSRRRAFGGAHQLLQNILDSRIRVHWLRQLANDVPLPLGGDLTIARERRKLFFVAKVLAPGFELFRSVAELLAQLSERLPKAVRIEVLQTGTCERILESLADRTGAAPVLTIKT
jgi:hypothetical protein